METEAVFTCVYCFQANEILVDWTSGETQEYVEDCQVCCRPNLLHISVDPLTREALVTADFT